MQAGQLFGYKSIVFYISDHKKAVMQDLREAHECNLSSSTGVSFFIVAFNFVAYRYPFSSSGRLSLLAGGALAKLLRSDSEDTRFDWLDFDKWRLKSNHSNQPFSLL